MFRAFQKLNKPPAIGSNLRWLGFLGILPFGLFGLLAWTLTDAASRRSVYHQHATPIHATVRLLGTADLVLSSSSRWLRHPSHSEPGAAFADAPAILDADPAGMLIGPPIEVVAALPMAPPQKPSF